MRVTPDFPLCDEDAGILDEPQVAQGQADERLLSPAAEAELARKVLSEPDPHDIY